MDYRLTARILFFLFVSCFANTGYAANRRQTDRSVPTVHAGSDSIRSNLIRKVWFETDLSHWHKRLIQYRDNEDSPRTRRLQREGVTVYDYSLDAGYVNQIKNLGIDTIYAFRTIPVAYLQGSNRSIRDAMRFDTTMHLHELYSIKINSVPTKPKSTSPPIIQGGGIEYGESYEQLESLGIPDVQAWDNYLGTGVTIGVVDDGFDLQHKCFNHLHLKAYHDFVKIQSRLSRWLRTAEQGAHGTGVLSVMAGNDPGHLIGGAPESNYLLARVFDERNAHNDDEASWAVGLEWCEEEGADIIQSSLTFEEPEAKYYDNSLFSKISEEIRRRGVILICAAGNEGPHHGSITAPSSGKSIIAVGALNPDGSVADYSGRGPTSDYERKPDFAVRGTGVLVANLKPPTYYGHEDGTSYAAPLVSSAFAMLRQAHPDWTADHIENAMIASSDYAASPDNERGYGTPWLPSAMVYPQLTGTLVDTNGKPVSDASVLLIPTDNKKSENTMVRKTNEKGEFEFNNVEEGKYWLWIPPIRKSIPMQMLSFPPSQTVRLKLRSE